MKVRTLFGKALAALAIVAIGSAVSVADITGRATPAGTTVPNPGTQEQELANITFPAPYNVFEFVVTCAACHGGTIDMQAAHFGNWSGTSMASAARDPVFRANQIIVNNTVRQLTGTDGAGNVCIRCHSPNGWYSGRTDPLLGGRGDASNLEHSTVLSTDDEGILCELCHRTIGGVINERADLDPADPAWRLLSGLTDWSHEGDYYTDRAGPAAGNPFGDTALQINDGMTYAGKYPGSVDMYFSDLPLSGTYTGQTYGIYPDWWPATGTPVNSAGQSVVVNPDGTIPIHNEVPIGPPLLPDGTTDYYGQAVSLEHPTVVGDFIRTSEFCGTCHDLTVPVLNHGMPEQRTYTEWKFSDFGDAGIRCQDCHMPTMKHEYTDDTPVSLNPDPVLTGWFPYAKDRNAQGGTAFHKFAGANRDLPMMMTLLYPDVDMEVIGTPTGNDTRIFPGMLSGREIAWKRAQRNTELSLLGSLDVEIASGPAYNAATGKFDVTVTVTNNAGHRLPSGYPDGRRLFLTLAVKDQLGNTVYESGYYDEATATLYNDSSMAGFNRAVGTSISDNANAVVVYERVTGTPNPAIPGSFFESPSLLNTEILFDSRIPPAGFQYDKYSPNGAKFIGYVEEADGSVTPFEDPTRFTTNVDTITFSFAADPAAVLTARAAAHWQTHSRKFMEHLKDNDSSTVRPQGPPNILDPNYPLTPNYLSDAVGLDSYTDLDGQPLRDNWGGIAYAAWLATGMGAPYTVDVADTSVTAPPAAPALTLAGVTLFTNSLEWTPVAGADGYLVYVRYGLDTSVYEPGVSDPASAHWDMLAVTDAATTTLLNDGLNVGKSLQYKVAAFNTMGMGPESNTIVARTSDDVPMAPTGLQVTAVTATTVSLSWFNLADNADGFLVERQDVPLLTTEPMPNFVQVADIPAALTQGQSYMDGLVLPLEPGHTYNYRVAAYNAVGVSLFNDNGPVAATTLGPPAPASGLTAAIFSSSQVDLAWADNATNETGFRIEASTDGITYFAVATLGPNTTSYSDLSVAPVTTYTYRVFAFNAYGDAFLPTNTATVTTPGATPPGAPDALTANVVLLPGGTFNVELTWNDNSVNETQFIVQRSVDGVKFSRYAVLPANATNYTDTAVTPDTTYWYLVYANNPGGRSLESNIAIAVVGGQIPEAPAQLVAAKISRNHIIVSWLDNSTNETAFELERSTDGINYAPLAVLTLDSTEYRDKTVTRGVDYYYRIRAVNTIGPTAWTYMDPAPVATK